MVRDEIMAGRDHLPNMWRLAPGDLEYHELTETGKLCETGDRASGFGNEE